MNNFRELKVWQNSRYLIKDIYKAVVEFPPEEKYALTSQQTRAVVSISANIAERSGRSTNADFAKFLDYSHGSCYEVESDLMVSYDLDFLEDRDLKILMRKLNEIEKMLIGIINSKRK